jgi:hypothetical protein
VYQCIHPGSPLNGRAWSPGRAWGVSVSYNSLVSYTCNYGYMLIGDSVRRCEKDREWTGTEPHCIGRKFNIQGYLKRFPTKN